MSRKDTLPKINGTAEFALDIKLDGMVYATVVHSPIFGGKVISFEKNSLDGINGILDIFEIESGIAIVGDNTWTVLKAARKIKINWSKGEAKGVNTIKLQKN